MLRLQALSRIKAEHFALPSHARGTEVTSNEPLCSNLFVHEPDLPLLPFLPLSPPPTRHMLSVFVGKKIALQTQPSEWFAATELTRRSWNQALCNTCNVVENEHMTEQLNTGFICIPFRNEYIMHINIFIFIVGMKVILVCVEE